jgi:hypothetical protein
LSHWQADPTNRWLDWEWLLRIDLSGSLVTRQTTVRGGKPSLAKIIARGQIAPKPVIKPERQPSGSAALARSHG